MANLTINVNTAVTHTEAITRMKDLNPNVSNSVTMLSDIVEVNPLTISVSDSSTITENINISIPLTPGYRALTTTATITQTTNDAFSAGGVTDIYGVDINLGIDNSSQSLTGGFRYTGLAIPQGATISAAKITVGIENVQFANQSAIHLIIYGEASGNTSTFDITNGPDKKTLTSASVVWDITQQATQNTPDFTAVIQEIVNRSDWASGNAMTIIIKDNGNIVFGGLGNNVGAVSSEGDVGNGLSAKLSIAWSSFLFDAVSTTDVLGMQALPIFVSDSVSTSESISNSVTFPSGVLTIDANISIGQNSVNSVSTPTFSTQQANEVLIALVSTNTGASAPTISGGGLTWVAVVSKTTQPIATVFSFRAFASSVLSNVQITVTAPDSSNYNFVLTVLSYVNADTSGTNGSGAIGTTGTNSSTNAQPSVTIVTARDGSRVVAAFGYDGPELLVANTGQLLLGFTETIDTNINAYAFGTSMQGANTSPAGSVKTDLTNAAGFFNGLAIEVMVNLVTNVTVNDAVTTSESITIIPTLGDVSVNDSTTTSESVVTDLISQVNVFDSSTTSENIKLGEENDPIVSDSVTTSESITMDLFDNPVVFDATTISESVTMELDDLRSVSDATTTSESIVVDLIPQVNVNDATTVSESITPDLFAMPSVNDATTISESLTITESALIINVNNSSTVTEAVTMLEIDFILVNDATTITENLVVDKILLISVNDTLATTLESLTVDVIDQEPIVETVTTSENLAILLINTINVNDATTTSESLTVLPSGQNIVLSENINTSESVTMLETDFVTPSDSSTISESLTLTESGLIISVNDASTTSESVVVDEIDLISVNDAATTSESITLLVVNRVSVSDSVTTSEAIVLDIIEQEIIFESVTTSENVKVVLGADINVNDAVTISESVTPLISLYLINLFENQNVTDIRHNYVTNPSFEGDSVSADPPNSYTNFTSVNTGALVRGVANDSAFSGTQSWKITETGGTADAGMTSPKYAVTPGNYTVSTYMRTALSVGQAHLHVKVYSGTNVTADYDFTSISGVTAWARYSMLIPVASADTSIELWLGFGSFNDTFATGSVWYDAVQIEQGSNLDTYIDGSLPGVQWDGAANLSASSTSTTVDTVDIIEQEFPFETVTTSESLTVRTTVEPFSFDSVTVVEDLNITQQSATVTSISVRDEETVTEFVAVVRNNTIDIPNIVDIVSVSEALFIQRITNIHVSDAVFAFESFLNMLKFNGINQYISLPYSSILHPTTSVTVEAWAYHANWAADTTPRDFYSNTSNGGYALRINDVAQTAPALCFTIRANNSYQTVSVSMLAFAPGWHQFVGTFDGRFIKIYSDTVLMNTIDLGAVFPIQYSNNNGSTIGANADQNDPANAVGNYYVEQLGQVRVYGNKAMTQAEIAQHYNQIYPDESTAALVYYFPEGTGSTTTDFSGHGLTGTLVNAPVWEHSTMPLTGDVIIDVNIPITENTITISESLTFFTEFNVIVKEDITIDDPVTVYVPVYNTDEPEDDVATSESTTLLVEEELVLEDDVTTSENVTILIDKNISVSDSSTVTQNSVLTIVYGIIASEAVATSESLIAYSDENPSVFEATTITEDIQLTGDLFVSVNDATTITENIQKEVSNRIFMLENVSVIESIVILRTGFGSVVEDVSTSEDIALDLISFANVEDDVTTAEDLVVELREIISIANTTVTSENLAIQLDILISAGESVATDDSVLTVELDNFISITETTTVTDTAVADIPMSLAVSDSTATSESLALRSDDLDVVFDSVATTETVTLQVPEIFSVEDDVTTSENVTLDAIELFSVNDTSVTSESVVLTRVSAPIVSDSVTTSESVTIRLNNSIVVLENVTAIDIFAFGFDTLDITVQEHVTVVEVLIAGRLEATVGDNVTITEYSNVQYPRDIFIEEDVVVHDRLVHVRTPDAPPPVPQGHTTAKPDPVFFAFTDGGENI